MNNKLRLAEPNKYVLKEELASKQLKTPIYFRKMTTIGPCSTAKIEDAQRFNSKQEAMMCPAYTHALSFYEPLLAKEINP